MSMQIEFDDDYNETTYYFGTVKYPESSTHGEHRFTVSVVYFSNLGHWNINEIVWDEEPTEDKDKAETRISEMVLGWHGDKCDITMIIKSKEVKDAKKRDENSTTEIEESSQRE